MALSAQRLGCEATIVMPVTTPQVKIDGVSRRGGKVVLHGDSLPTPTCTPKKLEAENGMTFIHPYDDPDVIAGQGTIGMENPAPARRSDPRRVCRHRRRRPGCRRGGVHQAPEAGNQVIGVQTVDSDAMYRPIAAGHRVELKDVGLLPTASR